MECRFFLIEFRNRPEKKKAERTAEEQESFGSWKRFGRKQPKTTLERRKPGDPVIVRMRGFAMILEVELFTE